MAMERVLGSMLPPSPEHFATVGSENQLNTRLKTVA
jgi:hypothetical protein